MAKWLAERTNTISQNARREAATPVLARAQAPGADTKSFRKARSAPRLWAATRPPEHKTLPTPGLRPGLTPQSLLRSASIV